MRIRRIAGIAGASAIAALSSSPAAATVTICGYGICVCITGKKNPDGCKKANVDSVAVVDDRVADRLTAISERQRITDAQPGPLIRTIAPRPEAVPAAKPGRAAPEREVEARPSRHKLLQGAAR